MTVSRGFYKKIQQWIMDNEIGDCTFQPFQVDGNPYKSKVFLVGASPEPKLEINYNDLNLYVESLVDIELFQDAFSEELQTASREYKGCLKFISWMKEHYNENIVLTNVNCLPVESAQKLKQMRKEQHRLYKRGLEIFEEVVNEFEPEILVLQGSSSYKSFIDNFGDKLVDFIGKDTSDTVQQLEQKGVIAKLPLKNGKNVNILVCRSMGYFGKEGSTFGDFKATLERILQ